MDKIFDKVLQAANDPQKHNPYHKRNEERDKEKEYNALTEPRTQRVKKERGES
jgi:hypothetical protein